MPFTHLKVPAQVHDLIRHLPPVLKRKIRAALGDILDDPSCGKARLVLWQSEVLPERLVMSLKIRED